MRKISKKTYEIYRFIIQTADSYPSSVVQKVMDRFKITRQGANYHFAKLEKLGAIESTGATKNKQYSPKELKSWMKSYSIDDAISESQVWDEDVSVEFKGLPENVRSIWHYGFTEIFNNAIDHSEGGEISVFYDEYLTKRTIHIVDDGFGIFKKIQRELNLYDERHSLLELAKGKLTTDPTNHSGEGIFFSSKMFDLYDIYSGDISFLHRVDDHEEWLLESSHNRLGTDVAMSIDNVSQREMKSVFDSYTDSDNYSFNKTIVPIRMLRVGQDALVSRSQAKRLLSRIEVFEKIIFDFEGIETIGQAFSDEVFRVFQNKHPEIRITTVNASKEVMNMILRARSVL